MGALRSLALVAVGVLGLSVLGACDTRAQPAAAATGGGVVLDPERMSKELESCSRTADCADALRCFDQLCRRVDRSIQGDYQAALAAAAQSAGALDAALAAYGEAAKQYDGKPPVDIDCAYGAALVEARADKERAELGARVLHRCVNAAPAGSALREAALRQIALLDESGLDPAHLSKTEPADVYLSRAPAAPKITELGYEVKATPEPTGKTWAPTRDAILAAEAALKACWEASFKKTKATEMSVGVPIKTVFHDSGYDDEPGYYTVQVDPKAAAPASDADRCVRDTVAPLIKGIKGGGPDWAATVVVTVK